MGEHVELLDTIGKIGSPILGVLGLIVAYLIYLWIKKQDSGNDRM